MDTGKTYDEIMREITSGLTGDAGQDVSYLTLQMEKYKDHPMRKEISRACGRLLNKYIPEDAKEAIARKLSNDLEAIYMTVEEVEFNIYKKNYSKALELVESLVSRIESTNIFTDDQVSEYRMFDDFFEEVLYMFKSRTEKTIRKVGELPCAKIYYLYGYILIELNHLEEAKAALEKSLRWNPVSMTTYFEYLEIFKIQGDLKTFFDLSLVCFQYAYKSRDVARCFRNLGYCFIEWKKPSEAIVCYRLSLQFEKDSKAAMTELYYISSAMGYTHEPTEEERQKYSEEYGFPLGPDKDIVGIATAYGEQFRRDGQKEAARYFFNIVYDLLPIPEVKAMLDSIDEE